MCLDLPSNIPKSHDDNRGIRWVELLRVSQRHLVAITKTIIQIRYHQCSKEYHAPVDKLNVD